MTLQLASGSDIPLTGFGTWKLRAPELEPSIREAIRVGYRHFDGAAIYENEAELGIVFHSIINTEKQVSRSEVNNVSCLTTHLLFYFSYSLLPNFGLPK